MPAIGNLVINDGAATPVAHTFGPTNVAGPVAAYADRSGGIPVGFPTVDISLREPVKGGNGGYKAVLKVIVPTLEQTSPSTATGIQPAPTVAYRLVGELSLIMSERSTTQERKNLVAYIRNALGDASLKLVWENLENVY